MYFFVAPTKLKRVLLFLTSVLLDLSHRSAALPSAQVQRALPHRKSLVFERTTSAQMNLLVYTPALHAK